MCLFIDLILTATSILNNILAIVYQPLFLVTTNERLFDNNDAILVLQESTLK